jgi:hypothetical protein
VTSPALATDDPTTGERYYRDPADGSLFPSVTTIIGFARSLVLERWQLRQVAEAAICDVEALAKELSCTPRTSVVQRLVEAPQRIAGKAASIGDEVHNFLESLARSETPKPLSFDASGFEASARAFLARFQPRFVSVEASIFNRQLGYAGTADFIAGIGQLTVIGDYKSGKSVHDQVGMQLAALARGEEIVIPDGRRRPVPVVDGGIVVHIRPEGFAVRPVDIGERPWRAFRALLAAWQELHCDPGWVGQAVSGPTSLADAIGSLADGPKASRVQLTA